MCRALLALCTAAPHVHALYEWSALGPPLQHDAVVAQASCIWPSTGAPVLAYGASDSPGDVTIRFLSFIGGSWLSIGTHTPQFAQSYDHFDLRCGSGALYLGIVIDSLSGLSSVLKNVTAGGGEDGFEGCYAFGAQVWDFEVTDGGDVRLASASLGNDSLALSVYGRAGWAQYPASDSWGAVVEVASAPPGSNISGVRVARAQETLYVSYALAAAAAPSSLLVGVTTLSNSTAWASLGAPFPPTAGALADAPAALAWGASASLLCIAAPTAAAGALVACSSAGGVTPWQAPVPALAGILTAAGVAIAAQELTGGAGTLFTVAAVAAAGDALLSATCAVAPGAAMCSQWAAVAVVPLTGAANDFSLAAGLNATLLTVSIGPPDGAGDALAAYLLTTN